MLDYEEFGQKCGEMWSNSERHKAYLNSASVQVKTVLERHINQTLDEVFLPKLANYTEDEIEDFRHGFYLEVIVTALHKIRKDLEEVE
jgi:soluble cytochrome b562